MSSKAKSTVIITLFTLATITFHHLSLCSQEDEVSVTPIRRGRLARLRPTPLQLSVIAGTYSPSSIGHTSSRSPQANNEHVFDQTPRHYHEDIIPETPPAHATNSPRISAHRQQFSPVTPVIFIDN